LIFGKQIKQFNKLNSHIIEKESPKISGISPRRLSSLFGAACNRQHVGKMKRAGVDLRPHTHDAIINYLTRKNRVT
jgi:hypothetical protein